jgi:predicted membrane channel-forming protein YqfA (hemolysin III family)
LPSKINQNGLETKKGLQRISILIASTFITVACIQGYRKIGIPVVVIVGGSGIIGFLMWYRTYLKHPVDPKVSLPLFLLTVAAWRRICAKNI